MSKSEAEIEEAGKSKKKKKTKSKQIKSNQIQCKNFYQTCVCLSMRTKTQIAIALFFLSSLLLRWDGLTPLVSFVFNSLEPKKIPSLAEKGAAFFADFYRIGLHENDEAGFKGARFVHEQGESNKSWKLQAGSDY